MKNNINNLLIIIILLLILIFIIHIIDNFINYKQIYKKYKIAVLLFGFSPRSFRYTYNYINNNIIHELDKYYYTDVYHHTLLSKSNTLESNREGEHAYKINNNDYKLLATKNTKYHYQEDIKNPFKNVTEKNHYRALFSEFEVSKFLYNNTYDVCVVLTNDGMPLKKINKHEIDDVINNKNVIYTTGYNTWGGIANGFYITTPNIYKIIANRINLYENWINNNSKGNAEQFLSFAMSQHNYIINKKSDMFYLKIRANGKSNHYIKLIENFKIPYSWYYLLLYK